MTSRHLTRRGLAACGAILAASSPLAALELVVPVACEVGTSCFIQQYMDHDPSPEARDYACGTAAYDDHDGTDFRLRTTRDAEQGVAVLAAAAGRVTAQRDGMADRLRRTPEDMERIADRECGNGVVIDHGDGWETQYCHLRRGSLTVEVGNQVKAGGKIGEIGYSGAAAFPHLHLAVRQDGEPVDPFLGPAGTPEACGADARPLWSPAALPELGYEAGEVLDIGFAEGPVELARAETGAVQETIPDRRSPAIVAWGWAINLQADDEIVVGLSGPDGGELARNTTTLDRNKAQYLLFAGVRRPGTGWPAGLYTASFTVWRAGEPVVEGERELVIE
ncbi:MAG: M23 family metallopeptidase [Hyphomicrobiales bacterium]